MRFLLVFIPLLALIPAQAATVNISVSCSSQGQTSYSLVGNTCKSEGFTDGPSLIYDGGQYSGASASFTEAAKDQVTVISNPYTSNASVTHGPGVYQFAGNMMAYASGTVLSTASASVTYTESVFVNGSGTGYVRGYYMPQSGNYGGIGGASFILDGVTMGQIGYAAPAIPITLGAVHTFSFGVIAQALSDDNTPSYYSVSNLFQLGFFQADGVTNAAVSETPEPSTFALALLPLLFVGYRKLAIERR